MNVTVKKLSELKKLEKNVRRHNDRQISEYVRSLNMFGQIRPMVVDEQGMILVGNGMFEAMLRMGWESADCYVVSGLTEAQKSKLMLADNRVYELGMTDMDAFDEIIADLNGDFDVPGWDEDLLETLCASVKETDEMIQSYGVYSPEDTQRMQARQNVPVAKETAYQPPERPAGTFPDSGLSLPMGAEPQAATEAAESHTTRYVICPHCGERIPLTAAMIGGE